MNTKISTKFTLLFLLIALNLVTVACSDNDLEPIGNDDGSSGEDPEISDNPVIRLNSGGEEVGFGDTIFTADQYFTEGTIVYSNPKVVEIEDTDMDDIYLTERNTQLNTGIFSYNIPISNGTYNVKLHFAEIYWGAPEGGDATANARIFDVDIEGEVKLNNYDIYAEVGAITAIIKTFTVTVEDEELNIEFNASDDKPKLSALEVLGDGEILSSHGN